ASIMPFEYRPLRWAGKNQMLAFGRLKFAPHVPLPTPEQARRNNRPYVDPQTNPTGAQKLRERLEWGGLYVLPFEGKLLREKSGESLAALAARPETVNAER